MQLGVEGLDVGLVQLRHELVVGPQQVNQSLEQIQESSRTRMAQLTFGGYP